MKKSYNIFLKYFKHILKSMTSEDYFGIAAEVSYMLMMGIFPFILFLTAIFGLIGKRFLIDKVVYFLDIVTPDEITDIIEIFLKEVMASNNSRLVAIIGFICALFLATGVINSIIKALNKANGVKETRNFFYVKGLSFIMVFVNTFFLMLSINLIVFGKSIMHFIDKYVSIPYGVETVVSVGRWPLAFVFLFLMAAFNYYILPSIDFSTKRRSVIPGALFFCVMWLFGSWLFSIYVDSFGTYNRVYGSIAGIAIMMVWLQYTSMIMLIGGEINNLHFES